MRLLQGRRQSRHLLTLSRAEVGVAGTAGQAIRFPLGRERHHLERPLQIVNQAPQHLELLPILLAQVQVGGLTQGQQAGHHGADAVEVTWA